MKIKNVGSWSNLANMSDSPSAGPGRGAGVASMGAGPASRKKPGIAQESSFEQFRKAARQKEERVCGWFWGPLILHTAQKNYKVVTKGVIWT